MVRVHSGSNARSISQMQSQLGFRALYLGFLRIVEKNMETTT